MQQRLLPPVAVSAQQMEINGRSYVGTPGSAIDVLDFDGNELQANGWIFVALSGPTSARPTPTLSGPIGPSYAGPGEKFYDSTLDQLIFCDGTTWRSPVDGSSV
jgi:hypothetical protein